MPDAIHGGRYRRGLLAGLALIALSACSILPSNGPTPRVFELLPPPQGEIAAPSDGGGVLRVEFADSQAGYETEAMVYRQTDQQLSRFVTGRWIAPPAQLLTEAIATELERSGRFRAVLDEPGTISPDYRLDMTLLRLEQDYRRDENGIARLSVRVRLTEADSSELLASGILDQSIRAQAPGPAGFAAAAGIATRRFLRQLDAMIRRGVDQDESG